LLLSHAAKFIGSLGLEGASAVRARTERRRLDGYRAEGCRRVMLTLNGTDYRLCLLDTNAVSEIVKRPEQLRHFLTWSLDSQPSFIASFSLFTLLELRRKPDVYRQFVELFRVVPCMILKSHEQLLEEETRCYPDPSAIDPTLVAITALGSDGNDLAKVSTVVFGDEFILDRERLWNESQGEIVEGISSLVPNYPPAGDKYTRSEVRSFVQIAAFSQLAMRAHDFAERIVQKDETVDIDAFPSLKITTYTVFHKFYADRVRKSRSSDAFDIIISAVTPYVDAIVTEGEQAESLRKTKRHDDFIRHLLVYTEKDFRHSTPSRA